ncbi:MAG: sulfotransferase, partial [Hydrococcus sp. CSU_1_8]|nr:sulfotransferase [Hydrococcus sp. CSU_1_8]
MTLTTQSNIQSPVSETIEQEKPIFIGGLQRSGTYTRKSNYGV